MSLVRFRPEAPRFPNGSRDAGVAHPVERHLAKVEVASSSLVTRSKKDKERKSVPYFIRYRGQAVRQESAKLSFPSSNLGGTSKEKKTSEWMSFFFGEIRPNRFENLNAIVRWTVAADGWTEATLNFAFGKNADKSGRYFKIHPNGCLFSLEK